MTDQDLNDDQQMLADSARRFIERGYGEDRRAASLAHADGDLCVLAEALGHGAVNEPFIACAVLAAGLLAGAADEAARQHWLPALADGSRRVACAHEGRFEARAVEGGFRLNGHCELVLGGAGADAFLVPATLGDQFALFVMEAGTPGLALRRHALYDGQRAASLRLADAPLAAFAWRGDEAAWRVRLERALGRAIVVHAAETVGSMQRAEEITIEYLRTRRQFGRAIADNQVVQHRLVDLRVEIEEARALCRAAARVLEDDAADPAARARHVAAAKACVAHAAKLAWKEAVQLHGAIGMTEEYAVGRLVKRLAAACTLYGSEHAHLERLGELAFGPLPEPARPSPAEPR